MASRNDGSGVVFNDSPVTVVNGTSGQYSWSMPEQGNAIKKVIIYFNEYMNTTTSTLTFPTPFSIVPIVTAQNATYASGATIGTPTATYVIIKMIDNSAITGFVILEGM